jgi:hypothetical protein
MTQSRIHHICHICQNGNAFWGFGPPLTPVEVWTCAEHLSRTENMLAPKPTAPHAHQSVPQPIPQGTLL